MKATGVAMMKLGRLLVGLTSISLILISVAAGAQSSPDGRVIPGERYQAGWLHRNLYGSNYRQLWTREIEVPYLDLEKEGGGLTPVGTGGGLQTLSLRFVGADGTPYSFRSLDKDPTDVLPDALKDTYVADVVQDQISSSHPTASVVVPPMLDALGILHVTPKIVILPDVEALGEFRESFAGRVGTLEEWPNEGEDDTPGFAGSRQVESTGALFELIQDDPTVQVDVRGYLTARLLDLLIGDWDRHRGQWRWARLGERDEAMFYPIPEDRDQAFADYDGLLLRYARISAPQLTRFRKKFDSVTGMTWNGRDVDRRLLPQLDESDWDSIAVSVQERITDELIEQSVGQLPSAHFDLVGVEMIESLKARRDGLPAIARKYYLQISEAVDLHASDGSERVEIERLDNANLSVRLSQTDALGKVTNTYYTHRFDSDQTKEVRIYLHEGNDEVIVRGDGEPKILIRVIGGQGVNRISNQTGTGNLKFYDDRSDTEYEISNTHLDNRSHPTAPEGPTVKDTRDWGSRITSLEQIYAAPDLAVVVSYDWQYRKYGFRREPYSENYKIGVAFATGLVSGRVQFDGDWRWENTRAHTSLELAVSGLEQIRFFGFGNETEKFEESEFFRTDQTQIIVAPIIHYPVSQIAEVSIGLAMKYFDTREEDDFVSMVKPYGFDNFGLIKFRGGFKVDTRDVAGAATKGFILSVDGGFVPGVGGVEEGDFGEIHGLIGGLVSPWDRLTLGLRGGGKQVWGVYPFEEAAYVGGHETIRGFNEQRFAGDASLYGNFEVRLHLAKYYLILPGDLGLFGLLDTGRVFLEGENSDVWHTGVGGGIWIAPYKRGNAITAAVAVSSELTGFYLKAGFGF